MIAVFFFILTLVLAYAPCDGANTNCRKCPLVKCAVNTPEQCKNDEEFIERDGYCHCCDTCVPREGRKTMSILIIV